MTPTVAAAGGRSSARVSDSSSGKPGLKFRTVVMAVCAVVLAIGLVITGASFWVSSSFKADSRLSSTLMASMRHHMTADMLHDGLRGVVYRAMYAALGGDGAMLAETRAELIEYGDTFRGEIAAQDWLELPADVRQAVSGVAGPLEDYIARAEGIIAAAEAGNAATAQAALVPFDTAFSELEDAMSSVSDAIEAANDRAAENAVRNTLVSDIANWGGLALTVVLALALIYLAQRIVVRPLAEMTAGFERLARGDLEAAIVEDGRIAEIGAMGRVMRVFRDGLRSRAELAQAAERTAEENKLRVTEANALSAGLKDVVDAAVAGDFSRRVDEGFSEAEFVALATGVNRLMTTVDQGISETGTVLAALARTDLTRRVEGDYQGAFGQLRDDTNAVADKLTEIVGQCAPPRGRCARRRARSSRVPTTSPSVPPSRRAPSRRPPPPWSNSPRPSSPMPSVPTRRAPWRPACRGRRKRAAR